MAKRRTRLEILPGIGPNLAKDLMELGFNDPSDLRGRDPEAMYTDLCDLRGRQIDRCVLYAFRCAVYCSNSEEPEPGLTKWWNWKDRTLTSV